MHTCCFLTLFAICGLIYRGDANSPAGGNSIVKPGICHRTDRETTYVSNEVVQTTAGNPAIMYCCVVGAEFIGWIFLEAKINQNAKYSLNFDKDVGAQILTINNIQENDAGTYFCRVNLKNQEIKDFPVLLGIRAQLTNDNPVYYLEISKTQTIPLVITGVPYPTIHFFRVGGQKPLVENYESKQPIRNGRYEITSTGAIVIHNLVQADSGKYIVRLNQGTRFVSEDTVIDISIGARPFVAYVPKPAYNFTLDQDEEILARFSGSQLNIYWKFRSDIFGELQHRIIGDTDAHYFVSVDGALIVKKVILTDVGKYTGICKNPWGEVQVQTIVKKIITAAKVDSLFNKVGRIGENITLSATISGDPPPYISWWRNGVKIPSTRLNPVTSVLQLNFLKRNDAGVYTLVADNGASINGVRNYAIKNVTLFIEGFPVIDSKASSQSLIVTENRRVVDMKCVVNGFPFPEVRFEFNNITFFATSTITSQQNNDQLIANYKFSVENQAQTGTYLCVATNTYGTTAHKIYVKYMNIPRPPRDVRILQLNPNSVRVGWDVYNGDLYDGREAMIWTPNHVYTQSINVNDKFAFFNTLQKGKVHYFSVRASNLAGWSAPSHTLQFRTPLTGRPSPPLVLNRDIFLPTNRIRLYWTTPMNEGGAGDVTYTVKMCIWETERIVLDVNCHTYTGIRSNEITINGLLPFILYNFYVTADNSIGKSDETLFQVFSGPNGVIGAPAGVSPSTLVIINILITLLLILLLDVLFCIFYKTGLICWFFKSCLFNQSRYLQESIPLKSSYQEKAASFEDTSYMRDKFIPLLEKSEEVIKDQSVPKGHEQFIQTFVGQDLPFPLLNVSSFIEPTKFLSPDLRSERSYTTVNNEMANANIVSTDATVPKLPIYPNVAFSNYEETVKSPRKLLADTTEYNKAIFDELNLERGDNVHRFEQINSGIGDNIKRLEESNQERGGNVQNFDKFNLEKSGNAERLEDLSREKGGNIQRLGGSNVGRGLSIKQWEETSKGRFGNIKKFEELNKGRGENTQNLDELRKRRSLTLQEWQALNKERGENFPKLEVKEEELVKPIRERTLSRKASQTAGKNEEIVTGMKSSKDMTSTKPVKQSNDKKDKIIKVTQMSTDESDDSKTLDNEKNEDFSATFDGNDMFI